MINIYSGIRHLSIQLTSHYWHIGNLTVYVYLLITNFSSWGHGRETDGTLKQIIVKNFKKSIDRGMNRVRNPTRGDETPGTGNAGSYYLVLACRRKEIVLHCVPRTQWGL